VVYVEAKNPPLSPKGIGTMPLEKLITVGFLCKAFIL